jgi:hypothetical protein
MILHDITALAAVLVHEFAVSASEWNFLHTLFKFIPFWPFWPDLEQEFSGPFSRTPAILRANWDFGTLVK